MRRSKSRARTIQRPDGDSSAPTLRATTPADLLAVVPYLLGFHPRESLVLLALHSRRVELVARVDLPEVSDDPVDWDAAIGRLTDAARSVRPSGVVLIGYSVAEGRAEAALDAALDRLDGLPVIEVIHADGRRWWSRRCDDDCCPAEGTRYVVAESRLAAEAVVAGLSTLPDREDLVSQVAGPPPSELAELSAEAEAIRIDLATVSRLVRQRQMQQLVVEAMSTAVPNGSDGPGPFRPVGPDRALCLRLAALATDVRVRDVAWSMIDQSSIDHLVLWQTVVRFAPGRLALAPLCLLGIAAWVGGQGALMVCAFTRALEIDPGYSMARLLCDLNSAAVRPSAWEETAEALRTELGVELGVRLGSDA